MPKKSKKQPTQKMPMKDSDMPMKGKGMMNQKMKGGGKKGKC